MLRLLSILMLLFLSASAQATEIMGKVTDQTGAPLPFVNIYQRGTTNGTTSNIEGLYSIDLPTGEHQLVFQFIGYKELVEKIVLGDKPLQLDIQMESESVTLSSITVNAEAEDPAYAVIRKAIAKRKYYRDQVQSYSCDAYLKGNQKLLDAPEKILGQEVGDIGGILDSNRQGIIYLSESISKLHFERPNQYKEEMISSKVSGDAQGFSFNQARLMNISLYENQWDLNGFGRPIISPIANNALLFYKYKLIGTFYDKEGRLVNKIEVIPKRDLDPVYHGHIYIIEDLWNVHSAELLLTKQASKIELIDTFKIKQLNVNVADSIWVQFSQTVSFNGALFGFKFLGYFSGVFSNYTINPSFEEGYFNGEVFKVFDLANAMPLNFWDSIRPVPLTVEEDKDYVRKDSLEVIWNSKEYLDSIDRKDNRFKVFNLLTGYEFKRSFKKRYFSVDPPLNTLQFNTVQGWNIALNTQYRKEYDDYRKRWWEVSPSLSYGFSEKRLRGGLAGRFNFNNKKYTRIGVAFGAKVAQFNQDEPITPYLNDLYSLFLKENYLKLYEKTFGRATVRHELTNGIFLWAAAEFSRRKPLVNHSDYTFIKRDDLSYSSNDPLVVENEGIPSFTPHNALAFELTLRFRLKQEYISYPYRKFIMGSKYPDFYIRYKKAIPLKDKDASFDRLSFQLRQSIDAKLVGTSRYNIESSFFLTDEKIPFIDYRHFNGNQTIFANYNKYLRSFQLLPYYSFSTTSPYVQAHYEHHFEGFILNKIPFIKKLGFTTVAGAHYLYHSNQGNYLEITAGIDNIGFGILRFLRVDYVIEVLHEEKTRSGFVIGLKIPVPQ